MKNWRIIFILLMLPPFLWGAAKTPPTRNEILAKLYAATHRREAKPVESVRIVLSGKLKIEYLRKGNRSLLREDGKVTILYDGRRCWSNGTIGGNDATWIFQFLFALRPVPELFGNLKLFPEPDGDICTLLGRRDRYLTTALIAVNRLLLLLRRREFLLTQSLHLRVQLARHHLPQLKLLLLRAAKRAIGRDDRLKLPLLLEESGRRLRVGKKFRLCHALGGLHIPFFHQL